MQQTEKYKLNLIESSDPFLPDALNQNTQKVEHVLSTAIEEHRAETDARLTVLEAHHFAYGSFPGGIDGGMAHIDLGFAPKAVFLASPNGPSGIMYIGIQAESGYSGNLTLTDSGFIAYHHLNSSFVYIAFG